MSDARQGDEPRQSLGVLFFTATPCLGRSVIGMPQRGGRRHHSPHLHCDFSVVAHPWGGPWLPLARLPDILPAIYVSTLPPNAMQWDWIKP